ncbi:MAG TPA: helix-turn-helix domain-containing protein [Intrasporangium sp.]|uniref:GlxA family transcriptional regulator n=1 Tax=Intrasporangium sp. TaxID=1925024 RepID=UPI002F93C2EB
MAAHRVAVVVPTDFTLFELGVAVEVFAEPRPEHGTGWYDVRVCTAHPGEAAAVNGLFEARIRHGVEAIDDAETIIVVDAEENLHRPAEPEVIDAIRRAYRRGARLVSFCTGAFVLAAAGVLDGRPATTHWEFAGLLARSYPRIKVDPDVLYVDDGQVLTSAGTAAGIDLSLHIIRKDHGAHVARNVARSMVVAPHREGGQAQFVMTPVPNFTPEQEGVSRAMQYAMENLHEDLGLTLLASRAYMSPRNFSRRFRDVTGTTPVKWLNHQRLTRVRELLEQTDLSVERIAAETGFNSAVTLRQRFAQHLLTSPTAYRRAFRAGGAEAATPSSVGAPAA